MRHPYPNQGQPTQPDPTQQGPNQGQPGWPGPYQVQPARLPAQPGFNPALRSPIALGPPRPNLFQLRWPRRSAAAGNPVLIGGLITAVVAAASVPLDRAGIGWPIAGLGLLVSLAVIMLRSGRGTGRTAPIEALGWSAAALALLSVGAFRAAGWLFVLCLLAAFGCVALAVGRGRRIPAVLMTPITLLLSALRALPWVRRGVARPQPATPAAAAEADGTYHDTVRLLASIALGVGLLIVFGALFAGADDAFNKIVSGFTPELSVPSLFRWVFVGAASAALLFGAAFLVDSPSSIGDQPASPPRPVRPIEWLIPVGALLVLFALFVGVQLTVLFGDVDYVMDTPGLTFAEYARKGFWQLLVVSLLTLCVMAVTVRKAPRATTGDRTLLRVILGLLAACSLVVVGSALYRMGVYEQAYGYTRLRVLVYAFELWLGALFVLIMLAGLGRRAAWLPRVAAALWVVTLLGLAVFNPDRFIAARNVDRVTADNADVWYLRTLSADAAPELDRLPPGARECALSEISEDLADDPDDWRGWNLGRVQARRIVPGPVSVDDYPCYRRY